MAETRNGARLRPLVEVVVELKLGRIGPFVLVHLLRGLVLRPLQILCGLIANLGHFFLVGVDFARTNILGWFLVSRNAGLVIRQRRKPSSLVRRWPLY